MKKSKFALISLIAIDVLLLLLAIFLISHVQGGSMIDADKAESVRRITTVFGGVIGAVTVVFGMIWFTQKKNGN